jgi:hypothetical protein
MSWTPKAVALSWLIRFVMEINDGKRVASPTLRSPEQADEIT